MTSADINKFIRGAADWHRDPQGRFQGLPHWTPNTARRLARREGIQLETAHWKVLEYLRERYRRRGPAGSGTRLARELSEQFAPQGGRRYLYRLFPRGPVSQGSRIAGIPLPPNSSDPSFGNRT